MDVGSGLYMYDVVVKRSRSLSHLLMSSCSRWRPSAILDFKQLEISTSGPILRPNMRHRTKFREDRSNRSGDIALLSLWFVQCWVNYLLNVNCYNYMLLAQKSNLLLLLVTWISLSRVYPSLVYLITRYLLVHTYWFASVSYENAENRYPCVPYAQRWTHWHTNVRTPAPPVSAVTQ